MNPEKPKPNGVRGSRRAPPTNAFKPGHKGGPGRKKMPADLKAAIAADSLPLYEKAKALAEKAEKKGDLRTASTIVLALLKKSAPDATEFVVKMPEGLTVRTLRVDPKKLTREQLEALRAAFVQPTGKGHGG